MPDRPFVPSTPTFAQAVQLAAAASQRGDLAEAERLCRAVLAAKPDHFDALHLLAIVAARTGRLQDAEGLLARAVTVNPRSAQAHNNRGNVLCDLGRHADALQSYKRALAVSPALAEAHYNRGNALQHLKRHADALQCYDRAGALAPEWADVFNNRGNALRDLGRDAEALASYDRAIALEPRSADAYSNRGHVLRRLKRYPEAVASYDRAVALQPDFAAAHFDRALCHLAMGDYARGWPGYEWRWKKPVHAMLLRDFPQPWWRGEQPLAGKTILLYGEQGLGDTLQFVRYVRLVVARGATVVLEVPRPLVPLCAAIEGVARAVATGAPLPAFELHCPLMSLPLAFKTELANVPADVPYVRSDPARVARWQGVLGERDRPRVGLVWSGSLQLEGERRANRSLALADVLPMLPDWAQCVSLQKEITGADAAVLRRRPELRFVGNELADFADTAALVELMDVVVTVDTAVAHLAGAMGKRVWIMLEWNADWRWLLDREDSVWYPTARLFRQPVEGDWKSVVRRVREALESLDRSPG